MASALILVNGLPGAGKTTLAEQMKEASGWPLLSKDAVKEALALIADGAMSSGQLGAVAMNTVWAMAAAIEGEVIVESWWFRPRDLDFARTGVEAAGAAQVVEVWCEVTAAVARERYASRHRAAVHDDGARLVTDFDRWAAEGVPLEIGSVLRVDTGGPVNVGELVARLREAVSL
ncbi:AAA family ATPase [Kineococcus endophyticus]|uniref:AAA family ATPase n=1 Tax=Kineococcus endophyticus TaxID=1181883 RepID=A0ABV3PE10_9ACTN